LPYYEFDLIFIFQSCNDLLSAEEQSASEVTPLLLASRLHELLRAPKDTGKRVRYAKNVAVQAKVYLIVIRRVIRMVVSLELTRIFNYRWNVAFV
jgi:hypothetical protein